MIQELVFSSLTLLKGSDIKKLKDKLIHQFPGSEELAESIFSKKAKISAAKGNDRGRWIVLDDTILFFEDRKGNFIPHLKFLHKHPELVPKIYTNEGAARPILRGADLLAPGVNKRSFEELADLEAGNIVAVYIEGIDVALAIGYLEATLEDLAAAPTGQAVQVFHVCGDQLWKKQKC